MGSTNTTLRPSRTGSQAGSILVSVVMLMMTLVSVIYGLSMVTLGAHFENRQSREALRRFYVAHGALKEAAAAFSARRDEGFSDLASSYPKSMGGTRYSVELTIGDSDPDLRPGLLRFVATASDGDRRTRISMMVRDDRVPVAGLFSDSDLVVDGRSLVDSYDSDVGGYAADPNANATVGTNGNAKVFNKSQIRGDLSVGPGKLALLDRATSVTGAVTTNETIQKLPKVTIPKVPLEEEPALQLINAGFVDLGAGDRHWNHLDLSGGTTLRIKGPALIVADTLSVVDQSHLQFDTSEGPVRLFVKNSFSLVNQGSIGALNQKPDDLRIFVETGFVDLSAQVDLFARLYAPNSNVILYDHSHVYGSLVAKGVTADNWAAVHVDEAMFKNINERPGSMTVLSWHPLASE